MKRISSLDALRGWAILGVVFVHATLLTHTVNMLVVIGFLGQKGVMLFYIVSAFTLFRSIELRREDGWTNFFLRRFFRIAPLYYAAIVLGVIVIHSASPVVILSGFLFLNGFLPHGINAVAIGGWSVAVETTFYAMIPALFIFSKTLKSALLLLLASVCICVPVSTWAACYFPQNSEYFQFLWIGVELPVFMLGIVAYRFLPLVAKFPRRLLTIAAALLVVSFFSQAITMVSPHPIARIGNLYLCSTCACTFALALCSYPWRIFVNPVTVYLGKISYSIYLLHFFCLIYLRHFAISNVFEAFVICLGLSIPICSISYLAIEKPGINLGKRIIAGLSVKAVPQKSLS